VERYGLRWRYADAQAFVNGLAHLFHVYNAVLWQHFSYCPSCGGQCCVNDASDVRLFDLLALALLGQAPPALPVDHTAGKRACIYLVNTRCAWPDSWRTIKCWSFYCLGSGPWPPDVNLGALYQAVTAQLEQVVEQWLPAPLRRYEAVEAISLAAYLEDPVEFAHQLHSAITAIFVEPFCARYPIDDALLRPTRTPNLFLDEEEAGNHELLRFLGEALEEANTLRDNLPEQRELTTEQLMTDLETLVWIVEERPTQALALLQEMRHRYLLAPPATLQARMSEQLRRLIYERKE
jgi:hypothetical protein